MDSIIKYSVIIPVYNAEKTIERCLNSLLFEKRKDVEIIAINDGSKDNSLAVLNDYAQKYNCVHVYDQINSGVSYTRNQGIDRSTGRYILFVDSDDYVSSSYFSSLDQMDESIDLYFFQKTTGTQQVKEEETEIFSNLMISSSWIAQIIQTMSTRMINAPVNKRFNRKIIEENHIRFIETLPIAEDFNFCLEYALCTKSISFSHECLYYVDLGNEDSLSRRARLTLTKDLCESSACSVRIIKNSNLSNTDKEKLLCMLDYLHVKNTCTCIAETFKFQKPAYFRKHKTYSNICKKFKEPLHTSNQYISIIHRVMRILHKLNLQYPFFLVAVLLKEKKFKKYRT